MIPSNTFYDTTCTALWNSLHKDANSGKKMKKNQYQWKMAEPQFLALSWRDTKIVNYFTNYHFPLEIAVQWKREKGAIIKTPREIPGRFVIDSEFTVTEVSADYLKSYHNVDTLDQNIIEFRPRHRCRRWYIPVFWTFLEFAMQNAWAIRKDMQQKVGILNAKVLSQKTFAKVCYHCSILKL